MAKQIEGLLVSFLLLWAAIVGLERAFSPTFNECINHHDQAEGTTTSEENPPSFGIIGSYVVCTGRFANANGAGIAAFASIIIAAFTGTLWVATSRQAQLTREALIADKRAFVFPDSLIQRWEHSTVPGQYNWRLQPRWRNTGDTPTRDMTFYVECEIRNTMLPDGYAFTCDSSQAIRGMLAPKSEMFGGNVPRFPQVAITPHDIQESQAGKKFIYLWGWAKYLDVFPKTPRHVTHFCWFMIVTGDPTAFDPTTPGQPPAPGTIAFVLSQHQEGNYTTEEG